MKYLAIPLAALFVSAIIFAQDSGDFGRRGRDANNEQNAKNNATVTRTIPGSWTGNFATGTCVVKSSTITSVAIHKYILDGAAFVHEVTVDTTGSALIRIYYVEPIAAGAHSAGARVTAVATDVVGRIQGTSGVEEVLDPLTTVIKNYPTTTHSHTIEYRVRTQEEIVAVFQSLQKAVTGQTGFFQATKPGEQSNKQ